jgi:hypothetical protein
MLLGLKRHQEIVAISVILLAVVMTVSAAARVGTTRSRNLGPRLNRILSSLEHLDSSRQVVADIGCDHGLLSSAIASLSGTERVFASDVSVDAAKGALAHFESLPQDLKSKCTLLVGDGISPLLDSEEVKKVDTIILSGMGVRSVFEILSMASSIPGPDDDSLKENLHPNPQNGKNRRRKVDYWRDMGSINNDLLESLGVTAVITQPWPPNFLPLQNFYSCMLRDGVWEFGSQGIDFVNGYHQITSSFRRSDGIWTGANGDVNDHSAGTLNISSNPLFKRSQDGALSNEETSMWRDYLLIQMKSLQKRKEGLLLTARVLGQREEEEALKKESSNALPYGDIDEILRLLDDHISSMK